MTTRRALLWGGAVGGLVLLGGIVLYVELSCRRFEGAACGGR